MKTILSILLYFSIVVPTLAQEITRIHFKISSSTLSAESIEQLDSLIYYNIIKPNKQYNIVGYADNTGDETNNLELSNKRATAVFKHLEYLGIDKQNIDILIGKGAIGLKNISNRNNRRVDIVLNTTKVQTSTKNVFKKNPVRSKDSQLVNIKNLKIGDRFKLNNLFFRGGMAVLLPASTPTLEKLLQLLINNQNLKIRLEGHVHYMKPFHIDSSAQTLKHLRETDAVFQKLSDDRAKAVYDYLIKNGIDKKRLEWKGFSYSKFYESTHNNRRVVVRITAK